MKYERGYLDPRAHKPKNEASISIRVPSDDRETLDAYLDRMNITKSEWGRSLVKKELQSIKLELVNNDLDVHPRYTRNTSYTQKSSVIRFVFSFLDYLQAQKKPEFAAQAQFAQQHKGY